MTQIELHNQHTNRGQMQERKHEKFVKKNDEQNQKYDQGSTKKRKNDLNAMQFQEARVTIKTNKMCLPRDTTVVSHLIYLV
ncbi:hypothetical protein KSZ_15830 [Dictyobacter formicarum]|uniref:Uncharacterized protein n=1 Tax=Dictyobacter formicarum TaxID=2778368 RepID=A0ABQ3VBP3_9CHLR|nr:hypothetical protein KSZ_15830 [Dictyobacter formicarum]